MIKVKKLLFFSISILLFSQCNNDDDLSPNGQMTAIVGGQEWEAQTVQAGEVQGQFSIAGIADDGSTIALRLDGFEEDDYLSSSGSSNFCVWQATQGGLGYVSNAPQSFGSVTIEKIDEEAGKVSGKFIFLGKEPASGDTVSVVNGVFTDVAYEVGAVTVGDNFLTTKIDGEAWEATMVVGVVLGNKLNISATSADVSQTVGFFLPKDIAAGTYDLGDPLTDKYAAQYNPNAQTAYTANSGTLKIENHDKLNKIIEGTFHFESSAFLGSGSASLTEGSFYVAY